MKQPGRVIRGDVGADRSNTVVEHVTSGLVVVACAVLVVWAVVVG